MKPHPRIRQTVKWGGAAVTVLLVAVWIGSHRRSAFCATGRGVWISVRKGDARIIWLTFSSHDLESGLFFGRLAPKRFRWVTEHQASSLLWREVTIPLWTATSGFFLCSATAWIRDGIPRRRARLNLCPKCGYDRTGLALDAKCPECGMLKA